MATASATGVKRRHRRLLVVNVANGNSAVDDCVVLNVTPDTTTADVLHKVRVIRPAPVVAYTGFRLGGGVEI